MTYIVLQVTTTPAQASARVHVDDGSVYFFGYKELSNWLKFIDISSERTSLGWGYDFFVECPGYETYQTRAVLPTSGTKDFGVIELKSLIKPLPPAPTREQVCSVNLTFQGLVADTPTWGKIPVFEAALPWFSKADRDAVFAAKHSNNDTHCIAALPSGNPCYDEPGQFYYQFRELDWTSGETTINQEYIDLVVEIIQAGFVPISIVDEREEHALKLTPLVVNAFKSYSAGDLNSYAEHWPGWDGVFYGWSNVSVIQQWAVTARANGAKYIGIEFNTGHIPFGAGPSDYGPNAPMRDFDTVAAECFDFVSPTDAGEGNYEVTGRMVHPYYPPASRPGDNPPYYLANGTSRGPYYFCSFEFGFAMYNWVRADMNNYQSLQNEIINMRNTYKQLGCKNTG